MSKIRMDIPDQLKSFLRVENCNDFNVDRYFVTEDVRNILDNIIRMRRIVPEMNKLGIEYINTTLLYGKTGTGKTTIGKYIASQLGLDFVFINFARLIDGVPGQTAKNIADIFEFIAGTECVFMMDELDCVTKKRSLDNESGGELSRLTITFMQEMDYLEKNNTQSVIIAATNRHDIMDEALLSRFAITYQIMPLNNFEKEEYIKLYLDNVGIPYELANIKIYCSKNSQITQRNVESDMIRCIAEWIDNGKQKYNLERIK